MIARSAIVFPGQGSQSVGMLNSFIDAFPDTTLATLEQSSSAIGINLLELVSEDPQGLINQTAWTQPLMLCANIVVWNILQQHTNEKPKIVAGHSLGEYAALVASQVLTLDDATQLVQVRAKAMQQAVAEGVGAVAAILGLEASQVIQICQQLCTPESLVEAVNFNAPNQVVIAGHRSAVEQVMQITTQQGARKALLLPLSVPVHCALMKPASITLQSAFKNYQWRPPSIPIIHNVNAKLSHSIEDIQNNLVEQVYRPVLWTDCVHNLGAVESIIECGPGKVLWGLNRRIAPSLRHLSLATASDLSQLIDPSSSLS